MLLLLLLLSLLFYCLMYFPLFARVLCLSLFCYALLCALSSFAIILKRESELIYLLLLSYGCFVYVNVMWIFFTEPWVGLQCVIVVHPDHTHLLIESAPKLEQTLMRAATNIEGRKQGFYQIITYKLFISL